MKNTIYECHQSNKNGHLEIKHNADSESDAIKWLENNGGLQEYPSWI
jgi:hypothetical protein